MKRFFFLLLLSAVCFIINAQVPQGFNYQAIARDESKNPITDPIGVRFTIQSDSLGGTVFWVEEHLSVIPNENGMFNVVIGKGTRISGLPKFSDIDWTVKPKFIMTHIDHEGWKLMGSARLWTVPYAMVADSLGGPLKKLSVKGVTTNMEEALFEVKNTAGKTVFAVYNEGVRVYVADGDAKGVKGGFAVGSMVDAKAGDQNYLFVSGDSIRAYVFDDPVIKAVKGGFAVSGFNNAKKQTNDYLLVSPDSVRVFIDKAPSTKAPKGGFAVSGFGNAKAVDEEYLRVTRDSTRIYINDLTGKAAKGGFAVSGFANAKGSANFFNVATDANDIIDPAQNRILWYPIKNAFLTGKVLIQKPDSVGENSFASGFESKAKGQYSQALGFQAIARGDYSTAIGKNAVANKINSFAFGEDATAKNDESYAIGRGAIASGYRSFAFGSAGVDTLGNPTEIAYAKGDYSFAIGQGSQAFGKGAFTLGLADTASGNYSIAMGYMSKASGFASIAMGWLTSATEKQSITLGSYTEASGENSTAIGLKTIASGKGSTAMGYYTTASGVYSTAMGNWSTAFGNWSTAMGGQTMAFKEYSTAMGGRTIASGKNSTAMGYYTTASGDNSTAMGISTIAQGYASNAIGGNTTASGYASTAIGYYTTASGQNSTAMGFATTASRYCSTAMGEQTYSTASYSTTMGYYTKANTYAMTATGRFNYISADNPSTWSSTDPLFVIGNGTADNARSNAMTVLKNGQVGLQSVISPIYALELPNISTVGIGQARAYAWVTYSDGRAKTERQPLSYGLGEIMQLNPQSYYHHNTENIGGKVNIKPEGVMDIGLIAQEVYNVIPEAVCIPASEESDLWSLSYDKLVTVLVKAIQEQQQKIESFKLENDDLKSQLQSLTEDINQIKALLTLGSGK